MAKRQRDDSLTLIQAALYQYLRDKRWGKKAAKALLKKNECLADVAVDFSLSPLFEAIRAELDRNAADAPAAAKRRNTERSSTNDVQPRKEEPVVKEPLAEEALLQRKPSGPLRRLDVEYWNARVKVRDNSYAAKAGDDYVARAAMDLGKVKGKDFRSEKNKKKRASWRGTGNIDLQNHSVFFDSD